MSALADILHAAIQSGGRIAAHHPWPRVVVDAAGWEDAAFQTADGRCALLSLWGEADGVHMALASPDSAEIAVISLPCPEGRFPSVGQHHPPAIRLERAIRDLYGLQPQGAIDARPWLDHGRWGKRRPLGAATFSPSRATACTRSRSVRSMPASSNPAISASPPMARPWCGWRNGWATSTRGWTG
jgi:hypothetical protein